MERGEATKGLAGREDRFRLALEQVRRYGQITNQQYQALNKVSESTASRDLARLVELGSLKSAGRGPARRYLL